MKRGIDLTDLDVLLAVTEAGSFRGAASVLVLEPSAVSRRIRTLEDRLGASLFERTRSGVRLTEAGRLFHHHAVAAKERLEEATRSVQSAGRVGNGRLALGIVGSLSSRFLGQLIRMFRSAHPGVNLTISEGSTHDHLAAIADRSLDLAFVLGKPRSEGFDAQHLWSEPIVAALPAEDTRTAYSTLSLPSLADDQFIVSSDPPGPEIHDFIIRALSDLSFRPRISRYKVGKEALIQMVGLGFGISLVCGSEMRLAYPNVTFVPLEVEDVPFSALWSPRNDNPALRRFLSLARSLSRAEQQTAAVSRTPDPSP